MKPKVNSKKRVVKALSPEEATALSNIQSIVSELLQMNQGSESPTEEPATPPMKAKEEVMPPKKPMAPMGGEEEYEDPTQEKEVKMIIKDSNFKKILKALETTPSEGATASDDAEERMDEPQTELSEENLMEVAKTLMALFKGQKAVAKSAPKSNIETLLDKIVEVQKSSQNTMNELSTAFGHIINGMGIADQLKITKSEDARIKQVNKASNEEIANFIASIMNSKVQKEEKKENNVNTVRKSLADVDVLTAMVGKR